MKLNSPQSPQPGPGYGVFGENITHPLVGGRRQEVEFVWPTHWTLAPF